MDFGERCFIGASDSFLLTFFPEQFFSFVFVSGYFGSRVIIGGGVGELVMGVLLWFSPFSPGFLSFSGSEGGGGVEIVRK